VKSASEGRRDRLIPLLSQAILEAQSLVRQFPERAAPLAVVATRRVPASVADHLRRFAERHAPNVAVGIVDAEGFRSFAGAGLEGLKTPMNGIQDPFTRLIPAPLNLAQSDRNHRRLGTPIVSPAPCGSGVGLPIAINNLSQP
jgi:hypothetical protein